jgi:hypothetical protein
MKNLTLIFIGLLCSVSVFCQKNQDTQNSSFSDSQICGTWVLSEVKYMGSNDVSPLPTADVGITNGVPSNLDSSKTAPFVKEKKIITNDNFDSMLPRDSITYSMNGISTDSSTYYIINPDYTCILGTPVNSRQGQWRLEKDVIYFTLFDTPDTYNILSADEKSLIIQNIQGEKKFKRTFLKK